MPCGVFRWTLVYFGVYTDRPLSLSQTESHLVLLGGGGGVVESDPCNPRNKS